MYVPEIVTELLTSLSLLKSTRQPFSYRIDGIHHYRPTPCHADHVTGILNLSVQVLRQRWIIRGGFGPGHVCRHGHRVCQLALGTRRSLPLCVPDVQGIRIVCHCVETLSCTGFR